MSGAELKQIAEMADLTPSEVAGEARVCHVTLYKVYNDEPVRPKSRMKVERAIKKLSERVAAD